MRSMTRSTAGTFWSARGGRCAAIAAQPASTAITLAEVERYGVERLLDELAVELKAESYRVQPSRRVWIAKPGRTEQRPLSIPTVRDRIVQAALKLVAEPVFEADFLPCSFGFRPKRAAHDALQVLIDETWRGRRWVVETDIASCFESIPHDRLMEAVEERIYDRKLLKLVRAMLRAGVMESGVVRHSVTGTPQGGVVSPLLANVYLHRVDRAWATRGRGVLARYADDLVVLCRTQREAEAALVLLRELVGELGLELKAEKTRIVHLEEGGEGLEFLGFEHQWVRSRRFRHVQYLVRVPSRRAMQRARDRIRELTARSRLLLPTERIVQDVNRFLRGWAGYFRYGKRVSGVQQAAMVRRAAAIPVVDEATRLAASLADASLLDCRAAGAAHARWLGCYTAVEPTVAGEVECRPVKDVGEPCAGEPHARFEGEGLETGNDAMARGHGRRRETVRDERHCLPLCTAPALHPTATSIDPDY